MSLALNHPKVFLYFIRAVIVNPVSISSFSPVSLRISKHVRPILFLTIPIIPASSYKLLCTYIFRISFSVGRSVYDKMCSRQMFSSSIEFLPVERNSRTFRYKTLGLRLYIALPSFRLSNRVTRRRISSSFLRRVSSTFVCPLSP